MVVLNRFFFHLETKKVVAVRVKHAVILYSNNV